MKRTIMLAVTSLAVTLAPTVTATAAPGIAWTPCPQPEAVKYHAQCATLNSLALMKIPATGTSQGPVLADSQEIDGYGGSQLAFFLQHGDNYLSRLPQTHRTHDIVLFDPRGLGGSAPVHCAQQAHDPAVPEFPEGPWDSAWITVHGASVFAHCLPLLARTGLVEQAADLDAIRAALGTPTLTFLGQATGGELGVVYAARYPGHAGRIALDTPIDPYLSNAERVLDAAHAEETALDRFVAWCTPSQAQCALAGQDVARAYAEGTRTDELRIAAGQFLLGYPFAWPGLSEALASSRDGDPGDLMQFVGLTYAEPDYTASRAQTCADHPSDPAQLAPLAHKVRAAAPRTGGVTLQWDALVSCTGWVAGPGIADRLPAHVTPAAPVLITATTDDPINPPLWAQELGGRISGADVLVADVDGHGALDNAPCAAAAIDTYLATGALPARDGVCRN